MPEGLVGGEADTLWPELRSAAHAAGLSQKQLDALATPFLRAVAKASAENGQAVDPEVRRQQIDAEFAKLGPNGRQVARDVDGWIAGLHGRGLITDAERQALRAVGTAEGVRALGKLRELIGEKPIPTEALSDEQMAQADAERLLQEAFAENDMAKRERAMRQLQQLEKAGRLVSLR